MTPVFTISVGNEDLTQLYQSRIISLEITDNSTEQADQLSIELSDHDRKIALPDRGTLITVGLGYKQTGIRDMGQFIMDTISVSGPPDKITISAYAAPFSTVQGLKPFQTQKSRSFNNITLGNLVRTIASTSGLVAAISPALSNIQIPHLDQTNESDMNLLTRLARDYGALMKPTSGRLVFTKRGQGSSVTGKPLDQVTIDRSECSSYSAQWNKRENISKVRTRFHNLETGETDAFEASADENKEGSVYEHPAYYPDAETAKRGAVSILEQNSRSAATMNLTLSGRPEIIAEGNITLTGFKTKMNGNWLIKSVQHSLSKSGFTTTVQACGINKAKMY